VRRDGSRDFRILAAQLIDELMSTTFQPVRAASWYYHFAGLDSLALKQGSRLENICMPCS